MTLRLRFDKPPSLIRVLAARLILRVARLRLQLRLRPRAMAGPKR